MNHINKTPKQPFNLLMTIGWLSVAATTLGGAALLWHKVSTFIGSLLGTQRTVPENATFAADSFALLLVFVFLVACGLAALVGTWIWGLGFYQRKQA